jgi:glycosyltransferase involved in cell wall biosynthesis
LRSLWRNTVRVALLSCNARPGDAIGNQVAAKCRFFRERGAEVRVILEWDQPVHPDVADAVVIWPNPSPVGECWDYLQSCDLIVAEYGQYYALFGLLPLLADGHARIIVDYHGVTPPELWGRHNRRTMIEGVRQRGLVGFADQVIVHSRFTHKELREQCKIPDDRLSLLGCALSLPWAVPASKNGVLRQRLGLLDATVLLYVGRLAPSKRVPVLIDAVDRLRNVQPEVHLIVIGDDRDVYELEAEHCRQRARDSNLENHVHFLGRITDAELAEAYQTADLFVTASASEGFCIPVVEAMASGLPVIAARATALPDTLGDAGLTFSLDDADDLARVVRRVLHGPGTVYLGKGMSPSQQASNSATGTCRIGVICLQSDTGLVAGAERSLRTIAGALQHAGHDVEWLSEAVENGDSSIACRAGGAGWTAACGLAAPPTPLPDSRPLLANIKERASELDFLIVGPYLSRLNFEVARLFPEKTLLVPCFHDEPEARWPVWHEAYQNVAGFLYHSSVEQTLAQSELGFNHPNSVVIGTCLEPMTQAGADRDRQSPGRYVVYCGRYSAEKNLPLLLEYAGRYQTEYPKRYQFVFMGAGNVPIPAASWATDLGVVAETVKSQVLAAADSLVQLSCRESLSLAALEAWQVGTPVIASADCPVLANHIAQCDGGATIHDYASFRQSLNDLWENPSAWRSKGKKGQAWVREQYESEGKFRAQLEQALATAAEPLYHQLQVRGFERAAQFNEPAWQRQFAAVIELALHTERADGSGGIEVRRRVAKRSVTPGFGHILVPVQIRNWGSRPIAAVGPGSVVILSRVREERSGQWSGPATATPLPNLVLAGDRIPAAVTVSVPPTPGAYEVWFWAQTLASARDLANAVPPSDQVDASLHISSMRLRVGARNEPPTEGCSLLLPVVQQDLDEADRLQGLPDDYLDVTHGALARIKRTIKRKILHNFKAAYVDVLSRQQSAFNRQMVNAVRELADCCAMLDHAIQQLRQERKGRRRRRRKSKNMR